MQFLALDNLFFLLIIPAILLFYLLKRKYEDYQVSSILLWNKALKDVEAAKPWQRLRRNLLLILQIIIALFIILALLKPTTETDGIIAEHTIIVIDTSGSMLAIEDGKTRFQKASQDIDKLIANLGSNQAITLIEMGKSPKIHIAKSSNKDELRNALAAIEPGEGIGDDMAAFSLASSIAQSEPNTGIMWYGDGANYRLNSMEEVLAEGISFKHVQIGSNKENLSIGAFVTQELDNTIQGLIRIDNNGESAKEADVVIYDINGQLLDSYSINVERKGSNSIQLNNLPKSDAYLAKVETTEDGLIADNQLWSVPFTESEVQATLVTESGNHFISQALKATKLLDVSSTSHYPLVDDQQTDLWIFDSYVPDSLPEGNSLVIGPSNSSDWLTYNGTKALEYELDIIKPEHQLLQNTDWEKVHISEIKEVETGEGLETLIKSGDDPILLAGTIEGKRVAVLAFDLHQSDLPLRTTYPILIQNAINWLSPLKTIPIGTIYTDEYINIPFRPGTTDKAIITPENDRISLTDTGTIIGYETPNKTGLYKIEEQYDKQQETRFFSVQISGTESDIAPEAIRINNNTRDPEAENSGIGAKNYRDLSQLFILLALIVVFIEWVVYKRGY